MNIAILRFGYWSATIAFLALVLFFIVQLLQIAEIVRFPWDQVLIYGFSLCIPLPFLLAMLALHYVTSDEKKFWTHGALIFTTLYAAFVIVNYVVQLATVIPMTSRGKGSEVRLLEQTPHSLMWNLDAIGYIFMGLGLMFAVPAFERIKRQTGLRYAFMIHAAMTPVIAFVYFYPTFSEKLLLVAVPWAITAPTSMIMLARYFRQNFRSANLKKFSVPIVSKIPAIIN